MISFFLRMLNIIPSNAKNRFFNRFTTGGGLLLLMTAEQAGVLPQGSTKALEGVPNIEYWVLGAIALWLVLEKGGSVINYIITTKKEELENMVIETKIFEEKVKQEKLKKELNLIKDKK